MAGGCAQGAGSPDLYQEKLERIVDCLGQGKEIVMAPTLECVERGEGNKKAEHDGKMPLGHDLEEACKDKNDPRRLPGDIVKRVSRSGRVEPSGIRIIGALFCEEIDIVGVDLPYSLVLDRAAVNGAINARNAQIKGDLSFEYAVILGSVRLHQATVDGSVYGGASFMRRLRINGARIEGSWRQRNSIVFLDALIVRAKVAGDFDFRESAFSRLLVQSSQITGTLKLDDSEARCSYHISASALGYLTAANAGFGVFRRVAAKEGTADYAWWRRALSRTTSSNSYKREILDSPSVKRLADLEMARIEARAKFDAEHRQLLPQEADWMIPGCKQDEAPAGSEKTEGLEAFPGSPFLEFYVFETTVQSAMCIKSLTWPLPVHDVADGAHPVTILALNGSQVLGDLIIDLWGDNDSRVSEMRATHQDYKKVSNKHKFEAVGLSAGAVIYNFSDNEKPYITYLDGLKFDRVHKANPDCKSDSIAKLTSQVELPSVEDVVNWLNKNESSSSQPFNAFVEAFDKAGGSTTKLRVARKSADLCRRIAAWLPGVNIGFACASGYRSDADGSALAPTQAAATSALAGTADLIATGFDSLLWAVADHGYRPGKVVGPILTVLACFWLWFWFVLRIVGFDPKGYEEGPAGAKRPPWPIGFLFLFDRLIPQYKIRDEHYAIGRYYRRATRAERKAEQAGEAPPMLSYFGVRIPVRPLDEDGKRLAEKWLVVLRILGFGLAIFVIAAIGALVAK
jgi:hypothetical protein